MRVFGNDFEPGADRTETMKWVGESLAELYEFSKPYNVDVLLEMHGTFNNWNYALRAIEYSGQKDAGLVYNCDPRDVVKVGKEHIQPCQAFNQTCAYAFIVEKLPL